MDSTGSTRTKLYKRQAGNAVLIALIVAFSGSMLGVVFGIVLGDVTGPEAWVIGLVNVVTAGLLILVFARPAMATGVITGVLSIYFAIHLNAGAMLAYAASDRIVLILPYIIWFFPLALFHNFTNLGFYKRAIGTLVALAPLPIAGFVLFHPSATTAVEDVDAIVTFLVSFYAFLLFVRIYARYRDEGVINAALAEEAERTADLMRVNEERFRLISQATNDLIWDADLNSGRIWWNDTLLDSYGYDGKTLSDDMTAWESWVHPDDRERVTRSLQAEMDSNGRNWFSEYRLLTADGRTIEVVDRGLIVRDDRGRPVRMTGSTTDVTELRALEKKLRQSQKMEAVGQLTGGLAHDFNNLLTIILGSAETLADVLVDNPKARQLAETTMQAAERGATLTSRLLAFARRQTLAPEHLDPRQLLTGIEGLIRRTINENIEIEIKVLPDVWSVELDRSQLENAILNLVINARDSMPVGGRLTVTASNTTLTADEPMRWGDMKSGQYVMIAVSDTGCGMPPDVAERAFEPFFTTKEVGKGSGLGLSMVWGFVQQSNGHAQIYSEAGEGTTVKLYFPAASTRELQLPASPGGVELLGGTERILVVEDDATVRAYVVAQLTSFGYAIRESASAVEALAVMDSGWRVDLLFTDVVMPGGRNGRQLADDALLRQPDLKVLFTSGYTEDAIVHHGRLDPGVNLLGKPYRRADLAAKVRSVLDGGGLDGPVFSGQNLLS